MIMRRSKTKLYEYILVRLYLMCCPINSMFRKRYTTIQRGIESLNELNEPRDPNISFQIYGMVQVGTKASFST